MHGFCVGLNSLKAIALFTTQKRNEGRKGGTIPGQRKVPTMSQVLSSTQ